MTTDKKTLADVKPGGMVRLGDQAERARFEEWYVQNAFDYEANPIGSRDCALMRKAWNAALAAQPSPGGQGGLNYERMFVDACAALAEVSRELGCDPEQGGAEPILAAIAELREALAARQPVESNQPSGNSGELAVDAARQPVGQEPLWCLHVLGMDDVHPAPSKAHAEKAAAWHNEQFKDQAARLGISIEAKVVPWPHSAESHAAGVAEFIPQWLIPQWQLDALEPNAAPPAQAVDLGQFRDAITREYANSRALCDMPRILECERLLALIDGQAVGK